MLPKNIVIHLVSASLDTAQSNTRMNSQYNLAKLCIYVCIYDGEIFTNEQKISDN